ncbi:tRNA-specific adenosine deaminase subunit tad3, partial [Ascosphaera aggregata]
MSQEDQKTDYATPLKGHLVPLKTVQETRAVDSLGALLDTHFPRDATVSLSHLRRFARPDHLPEPLKAQVTGAPGCMYLLIPPPMPDVARLREVLDQFAFIPARSSVESQVTTVLETGKRKRCIEDAGGLEATETVSVSERVGEAAAVQPGLKLLRTKISLEPPTSLMQAQAWSKTLWPTQFNAAAQPATHSPPPPLTFQIKTSMELNAGCYLALAKKLGREAQVSGRGRGVGVVITDPDIKSSQGNPWGAVVAAAGDARYWELDDAVASENGPD